MLLSESHSFLFVHVPKAAGSSITRALGEWALPRPHSTPARLGRLLGLPRDWRKFRFPPHAPFRLFEKRIPEKVLSEMFKFAFVRNPWERFASEFAHLNRNQKHRRHSEIKGLSLTEYVEYEFKRGRRVQRKLIANSNGNIGVDFVGKFENLEEDFSTVCKKIGIQIALPHANANPNPNKKDWRDRFDKTAQMRVGELFAEDIEAFGYSFD
ncbi:MAG: sulfotransferase family 2 domain-containing protein [Planctomycetota bacterium]|jgi:hypothetical protein|nr:sulfotransferase family 2 domain-containing protein [Planctomycetota bacterium]